MSVQQYNFAIDSFTIHNPRALQTDTDFITASVMVGTGTPLHLTKSMGTLGRGTSHPAVAFEGIDIADDEHVIFTYAIVSSREADPSRIEKQLEDAIAHLATHGAHAAGNASGDTVVVALQPAAGSIRVPLVGGALAELAGWLESRIEPLRSARCDGAVAAALHLFTGAQLRFVTNYGARLHNTDNCAGTTSHSGCGASSNYDVSWSIRASNADVDPGGRLWHTIRYANAGWQPTFGRIEAEISNGPGPFAGAACAGVDAELQLIAVDRAGQLWHTIRRRDGRWQQVFGLVKSGNADSLGPLSAAACAGVNHELQVVGVADSGNLWHTVRRADGAWQKSFEPVEGMVANDPGRFSAVACAAIRDDLHLVAVGPAGRLWHTIRRADGAWQNAFGFIAGVLTNDPGPFSAAGCAGIGAELHLVAVGPAGRLWHTIRHADGSWQMALGLVDAMTDNKPEHKPGPFRAVACAGIEDELHLVAIASSGELWHTIRRPDGTWQETFDPVSGVTTNDPGPFSAVACAGVNTKLHLVGGTPVRSKTSTNRSASIAKLFR